MRHRLPLIKTSLIYLFIKRESIAIADVRLTVKILKI